MEKLLKIQQKLTPKEDKLGHFFWGFWYTLAGVFLYLFFEWEYWVIIPCSSLALSKEVRDYFGKGNAEVLDFFFTVLPSIITLILILIFT